MLTLTRAINVPLPCRSSRFSIRRALATPNISTRSSRRAAHDGPQRACVPCARSARDPRCCTCTRCRVSYCTHRIRAPPEHGYDVLCVACAFACAFMIPMQKIYQKLGRVRASHETMILGPWSVWSTYEMARARAAPSGGRGGDDGALDGGSLAGQEVARCTCRPGCSP